MTTSNTDITDMTPEDAFGIIPQERAQIDARHQQIVSNFQQLLDYGLERAALYRRLAYYQLSVARSPQQLEDDGLIVIVDVGHYTDGVRRMPAWRQPRMVAPGHAAHQAVEFAGDLADGEGRFVVERQILRPTQISGGAEWLALWLRVQDLVLLDQLLQRLAIESGA